jgi:hypothetical protein
LLATGIANAPTGKYVSAIDVTDGTITVTYGLGVNATILNGTLGLQPGLGANGDVIWLCGRKTAAAQNIVTFTQPATAAPAAAGVTNATMLDKYLPANCRT